MSTTSSDVFDRAVQRAHEWLKDLAGELGTDDDRAYAYRSLRTYLHVVRDRVPPEQAVDFASQLPMLFRGVFYEGWSPARTPQTYRDGETFLALLADGAQLAGPTEAAFVAEATTRMFRRHMSVRQVDELLGALPGAVRRLLQPHPPVSQAMGTLPATRTGTVTAEELPAELRSRVMAASGNAELRIIERTGPDGRDGYTVYALAGGRFVHMVLQLRPDGSVDEVTQTLLPNEIQRVEVAPEGAAIHDRADHPIPVPAPVAVAVGSLVAAYGR